MSIFMSSKAAQGFLARRTQRTLQPETREERCSTEKGSFLNGHKSMGLGPVIT
jgi:hypothetical protein